VPSATSIEVRVECIRYGSHDTNIYELRPTNGVTLPTAQAGAHIALLLAPKLVRHYSLLYCHASPSVYTIAVKRDAASRGGSSYIHEKLRVGDLLQIEPPRNNFPLCEDAGTTLLLAGGIGITPMYCMWQRLVAAGNHVRLVYSCRSRKDALFLAELAGRSEVQLHFDDENGGRVLDTASLLEGTPLDAHIYCCGPSPMLKAFERLTAGRPAECVHVEYFVSTQEKATEGEFVVKLARAGTTIPVAAGQSVLTALRAAGINAPYSCEEGICGACEVAVLGGVPDHRDSVLSEAERATNSRMMICCSGSKTPELLLDL